MENFVSYVGTFALVIVALEGLYLLYRLRFDIPPLWPNPVEGRLAVENGKLSHPSSHEARESIGAQLDYIGCVLRVQTEMKEQQFLIEVAQRNLLIQAAGGTPIPIPQPPPPNYRNTDTVGRR